LFVVSSAGERIDFIGATAGSAWMQRLVIAGASGHARVVADAARATGKFEVVGHLDRANSPVDPHLDAPIIGSESNLIPLIAQHRIQAVIVAIGDNHLRRRVARRIREITPELPFAVIIHPRACLSPDVVPGEGTVIMAGAIVNCGSRIGQHCILNTLCSLDHDGQMDEASSLAPGSILGGNCHVGELSAVSLGARLIHGIRIGKHTVIGAGATVLDSIPDLVVAYGTPARVIRSRAEGDPYL
jgi:sugar O-acyltransferase (sialic acid O-acetyltransferase NeuD family)